MMAILWQFSRPHTIVGTTLSVLALYFFAYHFTADWTGQGWALAGTLVACLAGNLYIVGLNQLTDVAIDRINKPHLPLAAGTLSMGTGQWLVAIAGLASLILAGIQGIYLLGTVLVSLGLGTAYSLPPARLKRFPFWAALCIVGVRGVVVNLGLFCHFRSLAAAPLAPSLPVLLLTGFVVWFSVAIALLKDLPDTKGDAQFAINTLAVQWGQRRVFAIAWWGLLVLYLGFALVFIGITPWGTAAHLVLAFALWSAQRSVDFSEQPSLSRFYQFIWRLFYAEYVLLPVLWGILLEP
ncbi:MAG: homogentisate phytyltransferase [Oscillatoriales cyanobacterium SM2_2_1]|nr:homogentisate phytyltransferase [Oscillatoriales cyanobacterium SM2_2_1]